MATPEPLNGVTFVTEDDGRVTARHDPTGVASFGETESAALRNLADALDAHRGEGETIDDPAAYLADLGVDAEVDTEAAPPWLDDAE